MVYKRLDRASKVLVAAACVSGVVACGGVVSGADAGTEEEDEAVKERAVCTDRDENLERVRSTWHETESAFGELGGSKWVGLFGEPGNPQAPLDIELELASATEGSLQVGPRAELPGKDERMFDPPPEGYLAEPLFYEGRYELRGAAFVDGELTMFLPLSAPFDDWCALQTSIAQAPTDPDYCEFSTYPSETLVVGVDGSSCHLEPSARAVDCGWHMQSGEHCVCTTSECFANVVFPVLREWETFEDYAADGVAIRLAYDEARDALSGVGVWQDSDYYLELTRVEE